MWNNDEEVLVSEKIREWRIMGDVMETIMWQNNISDLLGKKTFKQYVNINFINLSTMIVCTNYVQRTIKNADACNAYKIICSCRSQYHPHTQWYILIGLSI